MASFLEDIAEQLLKQYGDKLDSLTVVFPNRRAGLFFKDTLARKASRTILAPQVRTFEEMASHLSNLMLADQLTLIYRLYEAFQEQTGTDEQFDRFYFWGDVLLKDFSEVDMALVDAADIFTNLSDLKALEAGYEYLSEEQKQTIARFWKSFQVHEGEKKNGIAQQNFLNLWNQLLAVYEHFRQQLLNDGLAYEGLMYRSLAENMLKLEEKLTDKVVLVGLNALKKAEEQIVFGLVKDYDAQVFWDVDQHYMRHTVQEAGMFFRRYQQHPVLRTSFPETLPDHFHNNEQREVHMQSVTLEVGQAKNVGLQLEKLVKTEGFRPESVAIILPDEHLLFPMLHSIPEAIKKVNVTMGYPLRNTSLYSFVEHLLDLQSEKKQETKNFRYHHASLLALLRHPYVRNYQAARASENIASIERKNAVHVGSEDLKGEDGFYQLLLRSVETVPQLFAYLEDISGLIHRMVEDGQADNDDEMSIPMLERELLYHFYLQLNRLRTLTLDRHFNFQLRSFIRLLRQMFQSLRVPFTGEPLRGLQVMGLLESRNLDFDYVFVLSANEGILPPADTQTSFIPQNLKKGFGLFTIDQQDAFYAHAFFRLLHRSRKVFLFYNSEDMQHLSGEMSRFLYQLFYESQLDSEGNRYYPDKKSNLLISQHQSPVKVSATPAQPIVVEKSDQVLEKLLAYSLGSGENGRQQRLTPSALNTYLDCRLKFYFRYIASLQEVDRVEEEVDAAVFGNILHKVMEELYTEFTQREGRTMITAKDCDQLKGKWLDQAIRRGFKEHYAREDADSGLFDGRNTIALEIVRKMAIQILFHDRKYAPFEVLSLEARGAEGFSMELPISVEGEEIMVALKGIIDRIDRKNDQVRVLDYKTGRDERRVKDIPSLFDREDQRRNKAAMQAFFYALLYRQSQPQSHVITPGLINASELFKDHFDPRLQMSGEAVNDFVNYQEEFIEHLRELLIELFDRNISFDQTTDEKKCSFCPYANICY